MNRLETKVVNSGESRMVLLLRQLEAQRNHPALPYAVAMSYCLPLKVFAFANVGEIEVHSFA